MNPALRYYYYSGESLTPENSKLRIWFNDDNADNITLSNGRVTSQTDETGNYTRSTTAPAANPFYNQITSIPNEKGNILFKGAEGLKLSVNGLNHQTGEVFIVFRRYNDATIGLTNNQFLFCAQHSTQNNNYIFLSDFANTNAQGNSIGINSSIAGTSHIGYGNTKSISDKKTIANFRSDGSSYYWGTDRDLNFGKTFSSGSNTGAWFGDIFAVTDLISFGYRTLSIGTAYSAHYEYEFLYYDDILTESERAKVLAYLNNKHDCYSDVSSKIGAILNGTSNAIGQSTALPNRLKVALPKGYIRTGTNTFANLLFGTNNEGNSATNYGPEMSFVAALSEYLNQDIYLEKNASNGSRFCIITGANPVTGGTTTWNVSAADLYPSLETGSDELQAKMDSLGANKIIYFLIGGENDTFYSGDSTGFESNLNAVIDGVVTVAPSTTVFIINRIRDDLAGTGSAPNRQAAFIDNVQAALENIKNSKSSSVLLDMQNYSPAGDGVHFVGYQQLLIGRDAFELVKSLL